jgi:uncharacterized damage-inducible protein DinB
MLRELLKDTFAYIQPAATISDLTPDDAVRRLDGAPHSIAEIVGHLTFWQDWFLARCAGDPRPMAASAADGWRPVADSEWIGLRDRFLRGLAGAVETSETQGGCEMPIAPPIEFGPLAAYTVRDALTHVAVHNAHHLGQIVTLRQLMGRWPPASGSWTW